MKTEGCDGWLCYIPVTSPFAGLNTKPHSQTLSVYILPLSAICMLTHNDTGKGVPSDPANKITSGILWSLVISLTLEIMKCKSANVSRVKFQPSLSTVYWLCGKIHMWLKHTWIQNETACQHLAGVSHSESKQNAWICLQNVQKINLRHDIYSHL
jgi:hypothetical protein